MASKKQIWMVWVVLTAFLSSYYAYALMGKLKSNYLPGETTSGHYQIEMACEACHASPFGGKEVLQKACMNCHGAELKTVEDSHPKSKFTDPRNADRTAILDARYCITCHKEHAENQTHVMGVTLPNDFCAYCHYDIAKDRKSHKGMAFDTCANAGCHNFHDNKALYEDFLVKHANEPDLLASPRYVRRDFLDHYKAKNAKSTHMAIRPLLRNEADFPKSIEVSDNILDQWVNTGHSHAAVNCMDCHAEFSSQNQVKKKWVEKPGNKVCAQCHKLEVSTYQQGKHGMRLPQNLTAMQPKLARIGLDKKVDNKIMGCVTCHDVHSFNTSKAEVDACLACHIDKHSKAYKQSTHYIAWQKSQTEKLYKDKAVSCATCHLPRIRLRHEGDERTLVQHNQNENLRPNEKMIREICMNCHGLGFSINSLADANLVQRNFNGRPSKQIASIEMAVKRVKEKALEKERKNFAAQN